MGVPATLPSNQHVSPHCANTPHGLTLLTVNCAEENIEDGEGRLGYYSVASDGTTSLTFNSTSIQNAVILGLFTLVLGALVLPLFGLSLGSLLGGADEPTGYGSAYGSEPAYGQGLEEPVYNSEFGRRKGLQDVMSPVVAALSNGKKKYEEEEE